MDDRRGFPTTGPPAAAGAAPADARGAAAGRRPDAGPPAATAIVPVIDEGLGNSAYLVDLGDGRALAVDAPRDLRAVRAAARRHGLTVAFAADTHLHADFLSGALQLAADEGAQILASASGRRAFAHRGLADGDEVDLGGLTLRAWATPGHTAEHLAYLLLDGRRVLGVFTGGSLLVGAVARTDLAGEDHTWPLARALHRSLRRLLTLPDDTPVYPTHGAGSFCSAPPGADRVTTIGREKAGNRLLAADDEDAFAAALLASLGPFPAYFLRLPEHNRRGPAVLASDPLLAPLAPARLRALLAAGGQVIDVRPVRDYAAGHVPGSLAIPLREAFATWLGWLVPDPAIPLAFVLGPGQDPAEAAWQALKIGYENLAGTLAGGMPAWRAAGLPVAATPVLAPGQADPAAVLDVRQASEYAAGHLPGAATIELGALASWRAGRWWSCAGTASAPPAPPACWNGPGTPTSRSCPAARRSGPTPPAGRWTAAREPACPGPGCPGRSAGAAPARAAAELAPVLAVHRHHRADRDDHRGGAGRPPAAGEGRLRDHLGPVHRLVRLRVRRGQGRDEPGLRPPVRPPRPQDAAAGRVGLRRPVRRADHRRPGVVVGRRRQPLPRRQPGADVDDVGDRQDRPGGPGPPRARGRHRRVRRVRGHRPWRPRRRAARRRLRAPPRPLPARPRRGRRRGAGHGRAGARDPPLGPRRGRRPARRRGGPGTAAAAGAAGRLHELAGPQHARGVPGRDVQQVRRQPGCRLPPAVLPAPRPDRARRRPACRGLRLGLGPGPGRRRGASRPDRPQGADHRRHRAHRRGHRRDRRDRDPPAVVRGRRRHGGRDGAGLPQPDHRGRRHRASGVARRGAGRLPAMARRRLRRRPADPRRHRRGGRRRRGAVGRRGHHGRLRAGPAAAAAGDRPAPARRQARLGARPPAGRPVTSRGRRRRAGRRARLAAGPGARRAGPPRGGARSGSARRVRLPAPAGRPG